MAPLYMPTISQAERLRPLAWRAMRAEFGPVRAIALLPILALLGKIIQIIIQLYQAVYLSPGTVGAARQDPEMLESVRGAIAHLDGPA